jgi:hypothetical protein
LIPSSFDEKSDGVFGDSAEAFNHTVPEIIISDTVPRKALIQ